MSMPKMFPIQDAPDVPWSMMEPARGQVMRNHGQTLERLAERGGLGCYEAVCALESKRLFRNGYDCKDTAFFRARLAELVEADQTVRIAALEAENAELRADVERLRSQLRKSVPAEEHGRLLLELVQYRDAFEGPEGDADG